MGVNRGQCAGLYVGGSAPQRGTVQTDCDFVARVVLRNSGFIGDIAAAIHEQTTSRATCELATYRRSAPAAVVGIPAADLRPASFWATWQATKWPGAISRKGAISTLQMSM